MDKRSKMSEGERREREASLALSWARWYTKQLAFSVGAKRHERHYKPKFQEVPETLRYAEHTKEEFSTMFFLESLLPDKLYVCAFSLQ